MKIKSTTNIIPNLCCNTKIAQLMLVSSQNVKANTTKTTEKNLSLKDPLVCLFICIFFYQLALSLISIRHPPACSRHQENAFSFLKQRMILKLKGVCLVLLWFYVTQGKNAFEALPLNLAGMRVYCYIIISQCTS